jgi:hypothetical protein
VPDWRSNWSTMVVLPWSTWAMMAMLRIGVVMKNPQTLKNSKNSKNSKNLENRSPTTNVAPLSQAFNKRV